MLAVFYPIDCHMQRVDVDHRTSYIDDDYEIFKIILEVVGYDNLHIFDLNSKKGNQMFGGVWDFQELYNDEDLDLGYWVAMLDVKPDSAITLINDSRYSNEDINY